jgi:glycyl-tRNA synthetase beta chain
MTYESNTLLIEVGCEEIPARMIASATSSLKDVVLEVLAAGDLAVGEAIAWGGSRRLAVRITDVAGHQNSKDETIFGPPGAIAFDENGDPAGPAIGFAKKQGIDPSLLKPMETDRGVYAGFVRHVEGRSLEAWLAEELPVRIAAMNFSKTMRWAEGIYRWVRPVHWLVALHGDRVLDMELFGVRSGRMSRGHRFLGDEELQFPGAESYLEKLEEHFVLADRESRRDRILQSLQKEAASAEVSVVSDSGLLEEIIDLAEWPSMVRGGYDPCYLELPRELLITTLRYHQKCFAAQSAEKELVPWFFAVANTDRDPQGHIRRGNEWVVGGRLEDARYFWDEDRQIPLEEHQEALDRVVFHRQAGSYLDKSARIASIAERIGRELGLSSSVLEAAGLAARNSKLDLVTGCVGEFPELQGIIGGLLTRAQGGDDAVARAIYEHYLPTGAEGELPTTDAGALVSVADKLDTVAQLVLAGEKPSGSKDPFGLRRAANGMYRILLARDWSLSVLQLSAAGTDGAVDQRIVQLLVDRLEHFLRERGWSSNEVRAVARPARNEQLLSSLPLPEIEKRLEALRPLRGRQDFIRLVELVRRVDNILQKNRELLDAIEQAPEDDPLAASQALSECLQSKDSKMKQFESESQFGDVVESIAAFVEPVESFFNEVLVIDPDNPGRTRTRATLLVNVRDSLTRCFDIRELSGQAGGAKS